MTAIAEALGQQIGLKQACTVLNVPRSRVYRARQPQVAPAPRPLPAAALSSQERQQVRQTLNSQRFADQAPRQVYASLLDEGEYLCHWRTMYRVLAAHDEVRDKVSGERGGGNAQRNIEAQTRGVADKRSSEVSECPSRGAGLRRDYPAAVPGHQRSDLLRR